MTFPPPELPLRTFDRNDDFSIVERSSLPHWSQAGTLCFITWRTCHVHLLAAFPTEEGMLNQCKAWKRFMAVELNRLLARRDRFWEEDQFDHLVRSDEEFARIRTYIAENPDKACLNDGEFLHYTRSLA